jgi:hypothetical protein
MTVWIFNNNDTGRRGVWHIVKNVIDRRDIEAREYTSTRGIRAKGHKRDCDYQYYGEDQAASYDVTKGVYSYVKTQCTCGKGGPFLAGRFTVTTQYPAVRDAYIVYSVLCNQVKVRQSKHFDWRDEKYKDAKDGDHFFEVAKLRRPSTQIWEGDEPPGPVCSRCLKKVEKDGEQ